MLCYFTFLNTFSVIYIMATYIQEGSLPWYMSLILGINIVVTAALSGVSDMKNQERDDKLESLEKELRELERERRTKP